MMEPPTFGVVLTRLLDNRRLESGRLSQAAGVAEDELQRVLEGEPPAPETVRRLAPALGLHTADLFVMAGQAVPEDLAPVDDRAGSAIDDLVWHALQAPPETRHRLRQYAQSLPAAQYAGPPRALREHEQYPPGAGGSIVRMLHNRNLNWTAAVKILYGMVRIGPWSAVTVGAVGHGRKELSPELLAGFATVLAVPAADLAALTGIEPAHTGPPDPAVTDVAQLIWDVRRLTAAQVRQVVDEAKRAA